MAIFSPKAWRTSALSRTKTLSSVLALWIAVGILAGLPLIALRTEAGVVSDADARVPAGRVAHRQGIEHKRHRDSPRSVRARGAHPQQHCQGNQQRELHPRQAAPASRLHPLGEQWETGGLGKTMDRKNIPSNSQEVFSTSLCKLSNY